MTFKEANKLAEKPDWACIHQDFGIEVAKNICNSCSHEKKCVAYIWFHNPISKCNFFKAKEP